MQQLNEGGEKYIFFYLFGVSEMTEEGDEAGGMSNFGCRTIISQKKYNSSKSLYGRKADCAGGEKVISGVVSCCISGCDVLDMKGW